jgi:hypothetical protein
MEPNPFEALSIPAGDALFVARLGDAKAVFVGVLDHVGPPPKAFSGYKMATQELTYRVERVLRGQVDEPLMTVHHIVVAGSPALDGQRPALRPEVLKIGQRYIVAVGGTAEGKRVTANENVPPVVATPDNLARVEAALR